MNLLPEELDTFLSCRQRHWIHLLGLGLLLELLLKPLYKYVHFGVIARKTGFLVVARGMVYTLDLLLDVSRRLLTRLLVSYIPSMSMMVIGHSLLY